FHSPLVAAAVPVLAEQLSRERFQPLRRTVVSTVTGAPLAADVDCRELLCRQITSPVRFTEAVTVAGTDVDLWIELGPGRVLTNLLAELAETPAMALDACGPSLNGLLQSLGAVYALGGPMDHRALFAGRLARPFDLRRRPQFFVNPCERAPVSEA